MKTMLLTISLAVAVFTANAQHIEVGAHGGYGTTWLLNNNVSDQGPNLDQSASFGPVFGIHGGYFFPSRFGVVVELNLAIVNQKYTGKNDSGTYTYNITNKLNFIEIPVLLRKYSKGGFYFEVGPKFSFLSNATETVKFSPASPLDYSDRDVIVGYNKLVVSAAFGIGGHFELGTNLYADARLRFAYGFTDATEEFSQTELFAKSAAQEISVGTYDAHMSQQRQYSYKPTNLATGHVMAGITYAIPVQKKSPAPTPAR